MDFSYNFPAVRGIQAGREYYVSMVPLKLLPVFSRLMTKLCRLNVERKDESMNPVSLKSKSISWIIEQTMFFCIISCHKWRTQVYTLCGWRRRRFDREHGSYFSNQ